MWRRKVFRLFRRLRNVYTLNGKARFLQIRKAHQLFSSGKFSESAAVFESAAEEAFVNKLPQAPQLFLQAGAAHLKANEIEIGMILIEKGMTLLIDQQQWGNLRKTMNITINRLHRFGLNDEAKILINWVSARVPEEILNSPMWVSKQGNIRHFEGLPKECPSCGGPVNPREIDWFGSDANCNYCGSLLTGK